MHTFLVSSHCDTRSAKTCTNTCFGYAQFDQALCYQDRLPGRKPRAVPLSCCMDPELCSQQLAIENMLFFHGCFVKSLEVTDMEYSEKLLAAVGC